MKEKAIGKIIAGLLIGLMFGLVFGGLIDATCATSEKTTVSVTESSSLSDLIVEDICVYPDPPYTGGGVRVFTKIKNRGNTDVIGSFSVKLYFDGTHTGEYREIDGLPAGASKSDDNPYCKGMMIVGVILWPADTNPHVIKCVIDPDNTISESNEGNNERSESFSAIYNQPPTLSKGYVTPASGDTSTVFNYYVTYKDPDGDAPYFFYFVGIEPSLYSDTSMTKISGDYKTGAVFKYSTTLPALPAGESYTYYFYFEDGRSHRALLPPSGMYNGPTVTAIVHDMAVTAVQTSLDSPIAGQATTIYVTIKNEGNQQEKNVPVKAYVEGSQVGSTQVTLSAGESITKSFSWTPSTAKTYSVKGEVGIVSGETYTRDNTKTISVSVSPAPSSLPTTTPSPQTGSIIVTAILDQATFTITGPKTYHGSGKSWSEPNAPVGTYRIIYEAVVKKENGKAVGYDVLKKSEEKTLIAGGSVRFDIEYIKNTPPTRGKISYFCPSCCPTSAWEEPLGESCGKDDAAKYWFVAMRWPYAKWDYNIEDTVSTGLSKGSDWKNKKILVTNPKNGRQVVLEAKDWGPAPWTGRVIDASPTALGALDAETDEEVNIEFADKNAKLGPPPSTKFKTGDLIVTKKEWNLRSDRKIAEEYIKTTLDKGNDGEVLENDDNGKFVPDNKHYWWYVKFGDYEGWCAEDGLEKSEAAPHVAKPVLTSPLKITPEKDKYYVGDTLTAEFTITNKGTKPITFDKLTVGGRLNDDCPDDKCPDFTFRSTTLQPNVPYQYTGTFTLTHSGNYHFFIAYYVENPTPEEKKLLDENNWNTCIDLGEELTDKDRVEEIEVLSFPEGPYIDNEFWVEVRNPPGAYICNDSVGFTFGRNLKREDRGDDVKYLQIVLNANPATPVAVGGPGSPCHETNYFGVLTEAAIIKFQTLHEGLTQTGELDEATRAELNKLYLPVKHVPNEWVLNVTNTYQNEEIQDGCVWWEVEDVTDGIKGWVAYQKISDEAKYLEVGDQEELKNRVKKLKDDARIPMIRQEVTEHRTEFLPANFPLGLILAMAIQESGGDGFDNEIVALTPWGRGIMQIDTDNYVGAGSGIRWYNNGAVDYCRGKEGEGHGCTCSAGICYCEACKHYYTNTIQGIEANIKDGLYVLGDKYNCQCCYDRSKDAEWDEEEGLYRDEMGEEVIFYSREEECKGSDGQTYDSRIEKIKIGNVQISCNEFKVIDAIWRYNSRAIYNPEKDIFRCIKSDYLRCVADKVYKIKPTFGYEMPDKDTWIESLKAVSRSASIMKKIK